MTNKTLIQIINMKTDYNFGVEIEMNNIRRDKAAQIAASFFGTGRFANTHAQNGYYTWSTWDAAGREWKFQRDVSIAGPDSQKCELVTPILSWNDIPVLQELVRKLRKAGAVSNPSVGAGVHIHVSRKDGFTVKHIKNIVNVMVAHEAQIGRAIHVDGQRTTTYCKMTDPRFLQLLKDENPKTMTELEDCWYRGNGYPRCRTAHYNQSRYHMLNLHSFFNGHGTVEFRLFQFANPHRAADGSRRKGGLHAGELKAYIQLCIAMCDYAVHATRVSQKVQQTENDKFAMRGWLRRMGFVGEEFATAREHLLKRMEGDAANRFAA